MEMMFASDSQAIRDAYGLFWRKKSGRRLPDGLKGISLSNVTTFPTRVRVRLLKEICHLHQAANPTVSCFVTNYNPRPELKIRDRKGPLVSYTYSKVISKLAYHLSLDFLKELYHYARTNLPEEEVAERFLILSSDLLCTSTGDLISMSVDEGAGTTPPPPVPNPVPDISVSAPGQPSSSTPLFTTPSQVAQTITTSLPFANFSPSFTSAPSQGQVFQAPVPSTLPPTTYPVVPSQLQFIAPGNVTATTSALPSQLPINSAALPGAVSDVLGDELDLVDRRGRTRFSQRAAPYATPT